MITHETLPSTSIVAFDDADELLAHLGGHPTLRHVGRLIAPRTRPGQVIAVLAEYASPEDARRASLAAAGREAIHKSEYNRTVARDRRREPAPKEAVL